MRRPEEESSQIRIDAGDDLGDYAFHEFASEEQWFVEEATDGRPRWEALPESHPLSLAHLRRPPPPVQAPPIPVFKKPLLEKRSVRLALLGLIGAGCVGLVAMGVRSTQAEERPGLAAAAGAPTPSGVLPVPALDGAPTTVGPTTPARAKPAPAAKPRPVARAVRSKHAKRHKRLAKRNTRMTERFAD